MASIEGPAVGVIKRMIGAVRLPEGDELTRLLAFVAIHGARVPRVRALTSGAVDETMRTMLRMASATAEHWAATQSSMIAAGYDGVENLTFEEMHEYVERGEFKVSMGNTWEVEQVLNQADLLCDLLVRRNWTLLVAICRGDYFISSADPVGLAWSTPRPPSMFGPGFGLRNTDVTFPISSNLAILGKFEAIPRILPADTELVAAVNSRTGRGANEVYARSHDFPWLGPDHTIRRGGLLDAWKATRAAGGGGNDA